MLTFEEKTIKGLLFLKPTIRVYPEAQEVNPGNIDVTHVIGHQRPLRLNWVPEMSQDLTAVYGIDVEAELTALLSSEIAREIDRAIMSDLFPIDISIFKQDEMIRIENLFIKEVSTYISTKFYFKIFKNLIRELLIKYGYSEYINYEIINIDNN